MRVLVFCLGLSMFLHGGWLLLSKASTSVSAAQVLSLSKVPTLRVSEQVKAQPNRPRGVRTEPSVKALPEASAATLSSSFESAPNQPEQPVVEPVAVAESEVLSEQLTRVTSQAPRFRTPPTPPSYPVFARRQQQTGEVVLAVYLDANGEQERRQIMKSSGYQLLDQAAEKAVSRWQFLPEIHAGLAVPSRIEIPIQFALSNPT